MSKHFFTICFITMLSMVTRVQAQPVEIKDINELKALEAKGAPAPIEDPRIPDSSDTTAIENFIKDRFENANLIFDRLPEDDNPDSMSAVNVQHSEEYIEDANQDKQTTFDKIYQEAIERITKQDEQEYQDMIKNRQKLAIQTQNEQQQKQWRQEVPNFPVVNVYLPPHNERVLAPAQEHIPFFFSEIEILPTGQVSINETVVVIANGQKLRHGLTRALPLYAVSRDGREQNITINLNQVSINDTIIPYKVKTQNGYNHLVPEVEYTLNPGVYTYKFNYIVNRDVWDYENFKEFYWDVTGSSWNLVIARAGAIVTLPGIKRPLGQNAFSGIPGNLRADVAALKASDNTAAYISTVPLYAGDGLHIVLSMDKSEFIEPDIYQKFSYFLDDNYGIIICLLAGLAIFIAYYLSWQGIKKDTKTKTSFSKSGPILRYLAFDKIDKISFSSYILSLYRRLLVEIKLDEKSRPQLIRTNKSSTSLKWWEKKAFRTLFNKQDVITFAPENQRRILSTYQQLQKGITRYASLLSNRLNLVYFVASFAMLFGAETAIALLGNNFAVEYTIMISTTLGFAVWIWLLHKKFKRRWLSIIVKIIALVSIALDWFVLSFIVPFVSSFIILGIVWGIFSYGKIFARRNGLIKNSIKEALDYKTYLKNNVEQISLGRNFLNQQENIHALEEDSSYPQTPHNREFYKLDIAQKIDNLL